MKVGDLVNYPPEERLGIIVDFETLYDRFGEPVDRLAIVSWQGGDSVESEYPDMLVVVSESR